MSFMAGIVSLYFRLQPKRTEHAWKKAIETRKAASEPAPRTPVGISFRLTESPSGKVFYLNEQSAVKTVVFYLHGGGYFNDFSPFHWRFLKRIIRDTGSAVIAPAYRLVPYGTVSDAFSLMVPLYREYSDLHPDHKIIVMGDSAGGGLSLALAQEFHLLGVRLPDELILLSPWTDVTMSNPKIPAYQKRDPWITASFRVPGCCWAGDGDPRSRRVSPLFGEVSFLKHVTLFTGTREILYPDQLLLFEHLKAEPSNEMITAEGMVHVYPLIPIPEAEDAIKAVEKKILR